MSLIKRDCNAPVGIDTTHVKLIRVDSNLKDVYVAAMGVEQELILSHGFYLGPSRCINFERPCLPV